MAVITIYKDDMPHGFWGSKYMIYSDECRYETYFKDKPSANKERKKRMREYSKKFNVPLEKVKTAWVELR